MTYLDKLKDPRWQKKRLEIMQRDEWQCGLCADSLRTLHIHHLKYTTCDPWDELNENLITLCKHCHAAAEYFKKSYGSKLTRVEKVDELFHVQYSEDLIIHGYGLKTIDYIDGVGDCFFSLVFVDQTEKVYPIQRNHLMDYLNCLMDEFVDNLDIQYKMEEFDFSSENKDEIPILPDLCESAKSLLSFMDSFHLPRTAIISPSITQDLLRFARA